MLAYAATSLFDMLWLRPLAEASLTSEAMLAFTQQAKEPLLVVSPLLYQLSYPASAGTTKGRNLNLYLAMRQALAVPQTQVTCIVMRRYDIVTEAWCLN